MSEELTPQQQITALKQEIAMLELRLGLKIVHSVVWADVTECGRTAKEWCGSYEILRDAIFAHLPQFLHDDDVAEEAIFEKTIRRLGWMLRNVKLDEEEGGYVGPVDLDDFWNLGVG